MAKSKKISRREERKLKNRKDSSQKAKSWAKEWLHALIWALAVVLIIRAVAFAPYRIPTPSMEETLLVGDFLLVSKFHYGPRTPQSIGVPVVGLHIPNLRLPSTRLPGFRDIRRNDIAVFNYPIDEGIPSQKTNYIKRTVGMPGDTLRISDKVLYVNHQPAEVFDTFQSLYFVHPLDGLRINPEQIRELGGVLLNQRGVNRPGEAMLVFMSESVAENVNALGSVDFIQQFLRPEDENLNANSNFRFARGLGSGNPDHMPEVVVPFEGQEISLTSNNIDIYYDLIARYEGNTLEVRNNRIFINGTETDTYTVKMDYYFMMGDNRDNSEDSRAWGFVPDDHIVGRAWVTYFSLDGFVPRFSRVMRSIH